jgi:Raf kinase inhibitor-like YbhB/YbcL family protein
MKISSPAFENNGLIPSNYTCDGEDISPPLKIDGVPEGTKSLVLIVDDPDVPKSLRADGMWDHWIVFNIPPNATKIAKGEEPKGIHGKGTSGNYDYHGPCPPDKKHRYFFKLYALDTMLDLKKGVLKEEVERVMENHIIEQFVLIGMYERK